MVFRLFFNLVPALTACLLSVGSSFAQYTNVRISPPTTNPNEVSIAVNPKNPAQLAVGANLNYIFISSDSGRSWTWRNMFSQYGVWGDPVLMFDQTGSLYYSHLSNDVSGWIKRIVIQRSDDGGKTFSVVSSTGFDGVTQQDKEWLSESPATASTSGTIGTSWTRFDLYGSANSEDSSNVLFSSSTDKGETWSEPFRFNDNSGDCIDNDRTTEGATPAYGPNGEVYITWAWNDTIWFDRSLDNGKTFGQDTAIAHQPGGWVFDVEGLQRANGLPMTLCDNTTGAYKGRIYVLWSEKGSGKVNIWIKHSDDGGRMWSEQRLVNMPNASRDHFFPSMSIDPVTGKLYVIYYTQDAFESLSTNVFLARSSDGGETFDNIQVDESAFTPDNDFIGDYIHVAAYNGHVYPVWTRADNHRSSAWTALILDTAAQLSVTSAREPKDKLLVSANKDVILELSTHSDVTIELFDELGRNCYTLLNGEYGAGEYRLSLPQDLGSRVYFVRARLRSEDDTHAMVAKWIH